MTTALQEREASPLYVKTLRHYNDRNEDVSKRNLRDGGHYEILQKVITPSLSSSSSAAEGEYQIETAEIESCLEQFVSSDGLVLWQRVVVRSGPSSPRQITHASYMLPQDASSALPSSAMDNNSSSSSRASLLCWATFPDRPDHPLLCVLANPTLLCIWDVYPSSPVTSQDGQHPPQGVGNDNDDDAKIVASEELQGGEGHNIPLPFEACAIYGVGGGQHGLLLQRSESTEDIIAYHNKQLNHRTRGNGDGPITSSSEGNHDDDGFILKAPPRPVRLRDSTGESTTLGSLNVSTATTPTMMGGGGVGDGAVAAPASSMIPSLFSLHHPQGDILPVSTFSQGDLQMAAFTDVFEKILYTGLVKWVDEKTRASARDRQQHVQPICVTYNSQLRRHAVWEIKCTPPPPPQAPLWQVSRQWRSKNGWDSHLGVLQQDLEDFELVGNPGDNDLSRYDASSRNDALADALGVRRSTPRNAAAVTNATDNLSTSNKASRGSGVGAGAGISNRTNKGKNGMNTSLLSPLSRQGNESHILEVDTSIQDQTMSFTRMGPFASLHPKTTMSCIFVDTTPSPPAQNIFLASNTSGSGTLSLCLVCPSIPETLHTLTNPRQLTVFSLTPIVDNMTQQRGLELLNGIQQQFTVQPEGSVPCVAAQPIESSPIPKNYEPHRTMKDNAWTGIATDILLLQNDAPDESRLSLYRNTHHVVDCEISTDLKSSLVSNQLQHQPPPIMKITDLKNSCTDVIDIVFMDHDTRKYHSLRGRLSLTLSSDFCGETLLQTVEAAFENIGGLDVMALKTRADCIRLEHCSNHTMGIGAEIAKIVVLSLLRFDILGIDINAMETDSNVNESPETKKSSWEMFLECSEQEPYSAEYQDLFGKASMIGDTSCSSETANIHLSSLDLSSLRSLAVEHLKSSESSVATTLFDALHLFYEEMKLHSCKQDGGLRYIGSILCEICSMSSCNGTISNDLSDIYLSYYRLDLESYWHSLVSTHTEIQSGDTKRLDKFKLSSFSRPPSILSWIEEVICGESKSSLFADFNRADLNTTCTRIQSFLRIFPLLCDRNRDDSSLQSKDFEVVKILLEEGFSDPEALRDELPVGIALPLLELFHRCRSSEIGPMNNVDPAVLSLIGRDDMCEKISESTNPETGPSVASTFASVQNSSHSTEALKNCDKDGITQLELTSSMLFPEDNRIREAGRLLRSSKPSYLRVPRAIEVSDHDYERQKQEKLLLLSRRILALPLGRGMLTIGNLKPVPAEPLPLPELCLSGRIPPTNTTMALDTSECPVDMKVWPEFHNGVAAGLRLPLQLDGGESVTKITRTWIVYNRPSANSQADSQSNGNTSESNPQGQSHAHGGLLMALGMRGHLTALEMTDIFDYLTHGSVTTTVGCLLGMASNMRGTCDISVSKMLCLHIPSLIPQHFSTIDVASTVQAAAVAGAGLLYEGSSHRMMTEFLLNEIGKRPSNDGNVLDREAYTLACGIALGMVNLCKGSEGSIDTGAGLSDLRIEERLYRYIVGGLDDAEMRRRYEETDRLSLPPMPSSSSAEKCSCIYEGESINIDVTAPGATLALGLMYMKSGNKTIASAIALPDTHFLLEYVRPDFLMFRVISRALILWDEVKPTEDWIQAQIPKAAHSAYKEMKDLAERIQLDGFNASAANEDKDYDRQAVRYIYTHVVAAACFSIGLRYAGTGNTDAASVIFERVMELRDLRDSANPISAALRPPTPVLEMCLGCAAISLAMVLAGTGNLDALRLFKILRWPCTDDISYGSHQAYGTAIGLLFLGGGSCTLGRDPKDIAALIMAFYPRFPLSTSDNQYHLQALRNLYALAVKKRELMAIDVDTGKCVFAPIEVHFTNDSLDPLYLTAPCLLVNTDEVPCELRVVSKQHYPLTVTLDDNFGNKTFYVKRRSAHMYGDRPHFHTSLTQTGNCQGRESLESIASFTDDQRVLAFAKHFCDVFHPHTRKPHPGQSMAQFCSRILHECFLRDSQQAISLYLALRSSINMVDAGCSAGVAIAWDFRLIRSYYQEGGFGALGRNTHGLLNCELVVYLIELLEHTLSNGNFGNNLLSVLHKSPHTNGMQKLDIDEMDLS